LSLPQADHPFRAADRFPDRHQLDQGLAPLRPYLVPLAQEDRVNALGIELSQDARNFLAGIRARWGKASFAD